MSGPIRNPREPRPGKERRRAFSETPQRDPKRAWSPWDEPMDSAHPTGPNDGMHATDDDDADPGAGRRTF